MEHNKRSIHISINLSIFWNYNTNIAFQRLLFHTGPQISLSRRPTGRWSVFTCTAEHAILLHPVVYCHSWVLLTLQ